MKIKLGCFLLLVLIAAVPILASHLLPWWGTLLVLVAELILLISFGPRLIARVVKEHLLRLFKIKGEVLKGARLEVHDIRPTDRPSSIDEDVDTPTRYVLVDFTIRPKPGASRMAFYDPSDLLLVPFDAVLQTIDDPAAEDFSGNVSEMKLVNESGDESPEDIEKLTGDARLRITFACPPELVGKVKMRYYFEEFGELVIP